MMNNGDSYLKMSRKFRLKSKSYQFQYEDLKNKHQGYYHKKIYLQLYVCSSSLRPLKEQSGQKKIPECKFNVNGQNN